MPTVSVLIPVRNTAKWLAETVASVREQTVADWEIIAIDDGSSDASPQILQQLAAQEPRMRILLRENRGLVPTRNELLSLARGDYIAWLDSDDKMTPIRLATQLDRFAREPGLVCLGGACILTDPEGQLIRKHAFPATHEELIPLLREDITFYFPAVTMRREAALRIGGFREPFRIAEDYDICLRLSEVGRVGNVPEVVLYYRQHERSTANSGRASCHAYSRLVRELAAEREQFGTDRLQRGQQITVEFGALPSQRSTLAETHRRWAWWALFEGNIRTSRKYAIKAMRDAPWDKESWRLLACSLRGR